MSSSWRKRTIRICGGDLTSGPRDDCPNRLHDFPLPAGYVDASEAAEKRLRHRWRNVRCPDCGSYGWQPGDPTGDPCDERVPVGGQFGIEPGYVVLGLGEDGNHEE